jgi:hypothetical protein
VAVDDVRAKLAESEHARDCLCNRRRLLECNTGSLQARPHHVGIATDDDDLVAPASELGCDVAQTSLDAGEVRRADELEDSQCSVLALTCSSSDRIPLARIQ